MAQMVHMNKTLYLKDEDGPIWDKARELAGDRLSPILVEALKRFIADKEAENAGLARIVIEFRDATKDGLPRAVAFSGRWLIPPEEEYREQPYHERSAVAVGAKGSVVIQRTESTLGGDARATISVYPSFDEALQDYGGLHYRLDVLHEAIKRLGVPVQELDL